MASPYPGAIDTEPSYNAADMSAATAHATNHEMLWDGLRAVETELGTTPSGASSTVKARFDALGEFQFWTPPVSSGLTEGTGVQDANFVWVGNLVIAMYRLVLGGSSTITGPLVFNLPVNALMVDGVGVDGQFVDTGTATYAAMMVTSSATTVTVGVADASVTYLRHTAVSSTVPFTWAATDEINLRLTYISLG